jgi:hypothetical protein
MEADRSLNLNDQIFSLYRIRGRGQTLCASGNLHEIRVRELLVVQQRVE